MGNEERKRSLKPQKKAREEPPVSKMYAFPYSLK